MNRDRRTNYGVTWLEVALWVFWGILMWVALYFGLPLIRDLRGWPFVLT